MVFGGERRDFTIICKDDDIPGPGLVMRMMRMRTRAFFFPLVMRGTASLVGCAMVKSVGLYWA